MNAITTSNTLFLISVLLLLLFLFLFVVCLAMYMKRRDDAMFKRWEAEDVKQDNEGPDAEDGPWAPGYWGRCQMREPVEAIDALRIVYSEGNTTAVLWEFAPYKENTAEHDKWLSRQKVITIWPELCHPDWRNQLCKLIKDNWPNKSFLIDQGGDAETSPWYVLASCTLERA